MSFTAYSGKFGNPIDCTTKVDTTSLHDKSIIITGGASGLGAAAARAFIAAGSFVTIGDLTESGDQLAKELGPKAQFVKCDVTNWEDQLSLFKAAIANSPRKSCDVVLANAGIGSVDSAFIVQDTDEPTKPDLSIAQVNLIGVFYTMKLARHYFSKQPADEQHDRCLILTGSLASYLDLPGSPQYNATKHGVRGIMHCLRSTTGQDGIRANLIAPWFVQTGLVSELVAKHLASRGVEFASADDTAAAMIKIASDPAINGRSFGILPRRWAELGYLDLDSDDFSEDHVLSRMQKSSAQLIDLARSGKF